MPPHGDRTRCSGRTWTLAPTSSSNTRARPGPASRRSRSVDAAARLTRKRPEASAAPVELPETSGRRALRPHASGEHDRSVRRRAHRQRGIGRLSTDGRVDDPTPPGVSDRALGAEQRPRTPCSAASAAPAATSAGRDPFASTATGSAARAGASGSVAAGSGDHVTPAQVPHVGQTGAASAGCGTAGTRGSRAPRSCAANGACSCVRDCFCFGTAMGRSVLPRRRDTRACGGRCRTAGKDGGRKHSSAIATTRRSIRAVSGPPDARVVSRRPKAQP
jgi:hypothetical protein